MQIRIGYELTYDAPRPVAMMLMLHVHPSRAADLLQPMEIASDPPVPCGHFRDGFGNRCSRILAPAGRIALSAESIVRDSGAPDIVVGEARQHPVEELPDEALMFLLASRYCENDRLSATAWRLFGDTPLGWGRVQAICDYVHRHLTFGYEHARATRSALGALEEGIGVCRDFAHLAITFCRAMNIPARYCTGYLGDIGVPPADLPMDFSAWFEAYLSGAWYAFDARHNTPRIGRVLMARGRDAADVAISTTFGPNRLSSFRVVTDEVQPSVTTAGMPGMR
jgi:transglutaminase-like putative cysteine protease